MTLHTTLPATAPSRKDAAIPRASSRPGTEDTAARPDVDDPIRIACVPAGHDYSRALTGWGAGPDAAAEFTHLPDPIPVVAPGTTVAPGQWWPPRMLDSDWISSNRDGFDLVHVQFGVEQVELHALARACDALRASHAPLIVTVHDLINPQFRPDAESQKPHTERLDLLVGRADHVVTLTQGAAAEIDQRWSRTAEVIAHPAIVPPDIRLPLGEPSAEAVISVHLGDLRPNVRGVNTVVTVIAAAEALRRDGKAVRVRVHMRSRVRNERERDAVLRACATSDLVEVVLSDRYSRRDLLRVAAQTDICVLPYGHGTHSGWLELYYDLGVSVVSPDIGYLREQHDDAGFFFPVARGGGSLLIPSMTDALRTALDDPGFVRSGSTGRARLQHQRRAQRNEQDLGIRSAHSALYRRALSARAS